MWGEMARIIHEVQPRFVFVENSPMLTSRGLGRVLGDLATMGFDAKWGVLGAADVGANHQRDRIWIVAKQMAHTNIIGLDESKTKRDRTNKQQICQNQLDYGNEIRGKTIGCGQLGNEKELANPTSIGFQGQGQSEQSINSKTYRDWKASQSTNVRESDFWATEPDVGRVVNGMAARVDRLKAIGNGQVPLCAATAWKILNDF
jgi:DNA (cytosine-5)-methyltransferase 1